MRKLITIGALALAGWTAFAWMNPPPDGVRFFDVGQGDAALVSSGRTQLLIDGGPDRAVLASLGRAMPPLDRRIEFVVLTHPHTDHYRGLIEVVKRYRVDTLIVGVPGKEAEYRDFVAEARRRGTKVVRAAGQRVSLGPALRAEVVDPLEPLPDRAVSDPNNASVVLMVTAGVSKILMTGDAGFEQERRLLADGRALDADVLKVGHHGSRTSSSAPFLQAVTPRDAVVSSGEGNKYGHPTAAALARLTGAGAAVYRTDQRGTVTVTFERSGYRLRTER